MPGEEEKPALDSLNPKLFQRMFDVEMQHTLAQLDEGWSNHDMNPRRWPSNVEGNQPMSTVSAAATRIKYVVL